MTSKKSFLNAISEECGTASMKNPFKAFYGETAYPSTIIIVEKSFLFELLVEELKHRKTNSVLLVSTNGFPSGKITLESIKQVSSFKTKVYYLGDIGPVSLAVYYCLKKGSCKFEKASNKIKIQFLFNRKDVEEYKVAASNLGTNESLILGYLLENNLVEELELETDWIRQNSQKASVDSLLDALKKRDLSILDYLVDKSVITIKP